MMKIRLRITSLVASLVCVLSVVADAEKDEAARLTSKISEFRGDPKADQALYELCTLPWDDSVFKWASDYVDASLGSDFSASIAAAFLRKSPADVSMAYASKWCEQYPGTLLSFESRLVLLRIYTAREERSEIAKVIATVLPEAPKYVRAANDLKLMASSLDCIGLPDQALYWAELVQRGIPIQVTGELTEALNTATSRLIAVANNSAEHSLAFKVNNWMLSDYIQDGERFDRAMDEIAVECTDGRIDAAELGEILPVISKGILYRIQSQRSFFLKDSEEPNKKVTLLFNQLPMGLPDPDNFSPLNEELLAIALTEAAEDLMSTPYLTVSEDYFGRAIKLGKEPGTRSRAALAMYELYNRHWRAPTKAELILRLALAADALPSVHIKLAEYYYQHQRYWDCIDILEKYIKVVQADDLRIKANLLQVAALRKLGLQKESQELLANVKSVAKDSEVIAMIAKLE